MLAFVVFGFSVQLLLLAFFAANRWRPALEGRVGRLVYGMGLVAAVLAVAYPLAGQPWHLATAFVLYAAWSALGTWVDIVRPITWRQPPRRSIVAPYVTLLVTSLLAFWMPLWWVDRTLWIAFGVLYAAHTTINLASHRATPITRPGPTSGRS